jgi:hypothetical protein
MQRLLILVLAMGGMACAVEPAANAPPVSAEKSDLSNSSTADPDAIAPRFLDCGGDPCLLLAQCLEQGGQPDGRCTQTGVCCRL